MRKEDITRLEAFEMKAWRRMEKISWTEHTSNEVLKLVEEKKIPVNDNKNQTTELDGTYRVVQYVHWVMHKYIVVKVGGEIHTKYVKSW